MGARSNERTHALFLKRRLLARRLLALETKSARTLCFQLGRLLVLETKSVRTLCFQLVPLATLMEPPIVRMMEPGGGTQRPKEVVSRLGSGVERRQGRARLWRRSSGLGLITGAEGGGPSLSMLGLRRERYDSPSTTRS